MTKFEDRSIFKDPEEKSISTITHEYNNLPITTKNLERKYYYIEPENVYVAKERLQKYLAEMLLYNESIADYIMAILKVEMKENGTLYELNVHDIMERLI